MTGLPAGAPTELALGITTANSTIAVIGLLPESSTSSRPYYGLPASQLRDGDLHTVLIETPQTTPVRSALQYTHAVVDRTVTFAAELPYPLVEVFATSPVIRLRAAGSMGGPGSALGSAVEATFLQTDRAWIISESRGYLGASPNYDLRTGIFAGLAGWNEALYGVRGGSPADWTVECASAGMEFTPVDGAVVQWLTFSGQLMP